MPGLVRGSQGAGSKQLTTHPCCSRGEASDGRRTPGMRPHAHQGTQASSGGQPGLLSWGGGGGSAPTPWLEFTSGPLFLYLL